MHPSTWIQYSVGYVYPVIARVRSFITAGSACQHIDIEKIHLVSTIITLQYITSVYFSIVCRLKPLDRAGKVGKRCSRRRASSRLSAPGTSTTESEANDIYEGISDDSLTSGEMKNHSHVNNYKIMSGFF